MPAVIRSFSGRYSALNPTFKSGFFYDGDEYQSALAAFEAARILNRADRVSFVAWNCKPWEARRKGKAIPAAWLRPNFEEVQDDIMLEIQRAKFSWPEVRKVLLSTGGAELVYGNYIHDNYWGTCLCHEAPASKLKYGIGRHCTGNGDDRLARILMRVRQDLLDAGKPVESESQNISKQRNQSNGNLETGAVALGLLAA